MKLSKHAITRAEERFDFRKAQLEYMASNALQFGVTSAFIPDNFKRTKRAMERIEQKFSGLEREIVLFYDKIIFVFKNEVLVTIIKSDKKDLKKNE